MPIESADIADTPVARPTQKESRWLVAIVFACIALRVIVLLFRGEELKTDPDAYVAHAETLRQQAAYCVPGTDRPTAFRPPLYPVMLAALRLVGLTVATSVALINLISAVVLIIVTWWLARIAGLRGIWPAVAATLVGLDPLLLRYTSLPMTETLSAAMLSVALLQTIKVWRAQSADTSTETRSPLKSAVVAGLCYGLGGLCRPVIFLTCAVITCVMVLRSIRVVVKNRASKAERRLEVLSFVPALVAGLVLMPWIVRNTIQFERFIPATTHGGYTLLLGNNPVFYREVVQQPGQPAWQKGSLEDWQRQIRDDMTADGVDPANESDADRWQYARAVSHIRANPTQFLQATILRWTRFWALRPSAETAAAPRLTTLLVAAWYAAIWTGLGASMVLRIIRRDGDIQLLWWAVLSFFLLHSFYWTNTRMRAPLASALIVLSVLGWHWLAERSAKGRISSQHLRPRPLESNPSR